MNRLALVFVLVVVSAGGLQAQDVSPEKRIADLEAKVAAQQKELVAVSALAQKVSTPPLTPQQTVEKARDEIRARFGKACKRITLQFNLQGSLTGFLCEP